MSSDLRASSPVRSPLRRLPIAVVIAVVVVAGCGPKRVAVVGPLGDASATARTVAERTRLVEAVRIDFAWELNESGSRVRGRGVARVEPPYRARLDLFLNNGETVIAAALIDDELRLPYGSPDDILPPVDLMWATLGVFRPVSETTLVGGDRLDGGAERLRYRYADGTELHYEVDGDVLRALEMLEGASVVQWVRLSSDGDASYPAGATYRNLVDFRELKITRTSVTPADHFDSGIWDPR